MKIRKGLLKALSKDSFLKVLTIIVNSFFYCLSS